VILSFDGVDTRSRIEIFAARPPAERAAIIAAMSDAQVEIMRWDWRLHGRLKQLAPPGDWVTWEVRAGRGFGKTRTGSGWVHERAMEVPGRWIAMIAKNPADARDYMIEGPGGLLKNTRPRDRPIYQSTMRRLTWPNGTWATIYSAEEPDQLRGFSGDTAWLDEFAKWRNPRECWDNLQFGMREASSDQPRILITSTPRPIPILTEIEEKPTTVVVIGSSYENRANLAPTWFADILSAYEGTELGRQEIHAEILDEIEGQVYTSFSRLTFPAGNIDPTIEDTGAELLIGQDFNVNPMATVVAVRCGDECHVIDGFELKASNTDAVVTEIKRRYPGRRIVVCPDPSGKARKTSAPVGQTDYTILQRAGFSVRAPHKAPLVEDRVNNTQAMLCQAGRRRLRIHPKAAPLIKALTGLTYKEGTNERDKSTGFDHISDALDYLQWQEFNVLRPPTTFSTVHM